MKETLPKKGMSCCKHGNLVVTSQGGGKNGIALVGFLCMKEDGTIHATPNAPTWLSASERTDVVTAIESRLKGLTLSGADFMIETTWNS